VTAEPFWLSQVFIIAIHGRLLAEHGGRPGLRDRGLLESVLAGPRNHRADEQPDIIDLAALYAHAITRNRPFVDGNKRVALAAAGALLELNGLRLVATEPDAVLAMLALSRGELDDVGFAAWLRTCTEPLAEPTPDGGC